MGSLPIPRNVKGVRRLGSGSAAEQNLSLVILGSNLHNPRSFFWPNLTQTPDDMEEQIVTASDDIRCPFLRQNDLEI